MCCKLLEVQALAKPRQKWCPHCTVGTGCATYETRPEECRGFYCGWMMDANVPEHWAPKLSRMVLAYKIDQNQIMLHVDGDRADAWTRPPYIDDLRAWAGYAAEHGRVFLVRTVREVWALLPQGPKNLGPVRDEQVVLGARHATPTGPRHDVIVVEPDDPRLDGLRPG
jgi:hypothetical protein